MPNGWQLKFQFKFVLVVREKIRRGKSECSRQSACNLPHAFLNRNENLICFSLQPLAKVVFPRAHTARVRAASRRGQRFKI